MGGNRGSKKKSRSKSRRNLPGCSTDTQRTAPLDDQESEHILPTVSSGDTISSVETVNAANGDDETKTVPKEAKPGSVRRRRRVASRRMFTGLMERTGLCLCVVYQCAGFNHKTCDLCNPRRMAGYQKMENEQYRADHKDESVERDIDQYNSLLLNFYLDSPCVPEFCPLLVTRGMTTIDAIKGVALSQKSEDYHRYTIVEHWKNYEAERILEDHELIQDVRREQVRFFNHKFVFLYRSELEKYEYIRNKEDFFIHPDEVRCIKYKKQSEDPVLIQIQDPFYSKRTNIFREPPFVSTVESDDNVVESSLTIQTIKEDVSEETLLNPIFCGCVYVKQGKDMTIAEIEKLPEQREKAHWPKKYLLLRDKTLYFVDNHQNMLKFYYIDDQTFQEMLEWHEPNKKDKKHLEVIGSVNEFQMYSGLNTRRYHNAPYGGGIYLKRHDGSSKKSIRMMFCCKNDKKVSDPNNFTRKLWLAAMRLAKHGTKIKENYLQYKASIDEYILRMKLLREANNPRVAMDFSYGVGRVVDDPKEAAEIARGEARGSGGQKTTRFQSLTPAPLESLRFGPHLTQGYYHGNLSREQAEEMIIRTGTNGAFIVRDSKNRPGCLVITYMHALRPHHQYVTPVVLHDKTKGENIFLATCDKDTVFYDVHSLIEYHRLNKGSLQCVLTVTVKNPLQSDGTPPRHRKSETFKSRTPSPKAGPSGECFNSTFQSDLLNEIEEERQILTPLQIGLETDMSIREPPSTELITLKNASPQIDLLTSLESHPKCSDPLPPLSPCLSESLQREESASNEGTSPVPSTQIFTKDSDSNSSPRV